jgi:hypothetical protein
MKTITEIKQEIKALKMDNRYKAKPALIQINAPLALIQVSIDARVRALEWVLTGDSK